ncbi:uncharacterized protein LOC123559806 [Mercenaria mercenaria]|uniref:uncharacterized protein LOC123559806 n=1 Tax=Mercenaria mercenaria TaxID=6596 RepID=UPI00234E45D3|nr:uncharacterized protein LOC123559806 [Mercenaria mercenaria]
MKLFVKRLCLFMFALLLTLYMLIALKKKSHSRYLIFGDSYQLEADRNITLLTGSEHGDNGETFRKSGISSHDRVPNIIIQYGVGGTATTLQFQILCVFMAILHESEINSLGCFFGKKTFYKYTVIKTHEIKYNELRLLPLDTWIFMTSSSNLSAEKQLKFDYNKRKVQMMKMHCPYIADIETVSKRGHFIVHEYRSIFGVSEEQIQQAVEYLRFWDILRLCCGKQMSADWRNYLSPTKNYKPHHSLHSSTYPACEMYNISKVEQLLMNTYVFQRFAHIPSLRDVIGKPSNVDGNIDGQYCERCNRNISKNHLRFNDNCV